MTTIALNLPDDLAARLRNQVAAEPGGSLEGYVLGLIAADQNQRTRQELEAKLLAGLAGPSTVLDEAEWGRMRQEARDRATHKVKRS